MVSRRVVSQRQPAFGDPLFVGICVYRAPAVIEKLPVPGYAILQDGLRIKMETQIMYKNLQFFLPIYNRWDPLFWVSELETHHDFI